MSGSSRRIRERLAGSARRLPATSQALRRSPPATSPARRDPEGIAQVDPVPQGLGWGPKQRTPVLPPKQRIRSPNRGGSHGMLDTHRYTQHPLPPQVPQYRNPPDQRRAATGPATTSRLDTEACSEASDDRDPLADTR